MSGRATPPGTYQNRPVPHHPPPQQTQKAFSSSQEHSHSYAYSYGDDAHRMIHGQMNRPISDSRQQYDNIPPPAYLREGRPERPHDFPSDLDHPQGRQRFGPPQVYPFENIRTATNFMHRPGIERDVPLRAQPYYTEGFTEQQVRYQQGPPQTHITQPTINPMYRRLEESPHMPLQSQSRYQDSETSVQYRSQAGPEISGDRTGGHRFQSGEPLRSGAQRDRLEMGQRHETTEAVGPRGPSDRSETGHRYQSEQSAFHRSQMDRQKGISERPDMNRHYRGPGLQPYGDRFADFQQRPLDKRSREQHGQQYDGQSAVGRQGGLGDTPLEMPRDHMRGAPQEVPPQSRFPQQQSADSRNLGRGQSNQDPANYRPEHQGVRLVDEKPHKMSPFFTTQQPQTHSQPVVHQVKKGPPAYQIPAILSCVCCPCWCLGAAAIWFSMKTQEKRYQGDMNGAQKASDRTKILIVAAVIAGILAWIIIVLSSIFGR